MLDSRQKQEHAQLLQQPERLAVLERSHLLDTSAEEAFDRFTRLAATLLAVPVSLVSLIDTNRQYFKSFVGLPEQWAIQRETPLSHSFCQYVVSSQEPLIIEDAREHPVVGSNLAIPELGVIAYVGIPLTAREQTLGSFCAIDNKPRKWAQREIAIMKELAHFVTTEIELRILLQEKEYAEQAMKDARDYAESIVETMREPLLVLDGQLRVLSANNAFYKLFETTKKETEQQFLYELGTGQWNNALLRTLLEEISSKNRTFEDFEVEHNFPRIGRRTVLLHARQLRQTAVQQPFILLTMEDITLRKQLEQQKDEFIGIASHELKTPVAGMKGFAQLLQRRLERSGGKEEAYFAGNIALLSDRLTQLINDLLNVSRIQAGKLPLHIQEFDLDSLVSKIVKDLQYTTGTHRIIQEGTLQKRVIGDPHRIEQVLSNLLTNALKYSPQADMVIVSVADNKKDAKVSVRDFGAGIAERDRERIFERFYRTPDTERENVTGFGLGLYIAAEIIKEHGGKIWVESKEGEGSTFCFTLPLGIHQIEASPQ